MSINPRVVGTIFYFSRSMCVVSILMLFWPRCRFATPSANVRQSYFFPPPDVIRSECLCVCVFSLHHSEHLSVHCGIHLTHLSLYARCCEHETDAAPLAASLASAPHAAHLTSSGRFSCNSLQQQQATQPTPTPPSLPTPTPSQLPPTTTIPPSPPSPTTTSALSSTSTSSSFHLGRSTP